ncbi:fluoride efflux transporter CrcB [Spiribacter sp. C176]|uniref:Fluoride-specific ion channel FluC n=1 Tax=Spiribacter salilacus TaxID=2664894 RepID=A0A6N7QS82_9GAMM|nr:fluoride efflux transporter CrcB [Spiribacter salilacus]MRH77177.1 fluoride efflux transporter CrcB [Spiribacter salilacus]
MPAVNEWVAVASGGALGATLRFSVVMLADRVLPRGFPWGTLFVNVLGSAVIGVVFVLLIERGLLSPAWRSFLTIGLLGAFTTFSAFSLEAVSLLNTGEAGRAAVYVLASVMLCIAAAMVGMAIARGLITVFV